MMNKIHKKGFVVPVLIIFVGLALLFTMIIRQDLVQPHQKFVGQRQLEILQTATEAQKLNTYIDLSARMAAYQSIHELATKTGNPYGTKCGYYNGYVLLQNYDDVGNMDNCFSDDIKQSFESAFNDKIGSSFENYGVASPTYDINYEAKDGKTKIFGRANSKILYGLFGQELLDTYNRKVSYSQNGQIDYDSDRAEPQRDEESAQDPLGSQVQDDCGELDLIDIKSSLRCDSSVSCQVDPQIYDLLLQVQKQAKDKYDYDLLVTAAYRPYSIQKKWFEEGTPSHPEWAGDSTKIAKPSCDSPHAKGKAVDVILVNSAGIPISGMESVNVASMANNNRKILETLMTDVGFVRYGNIDGTKGEFWHYEYKTSRWDRAVASSQKEGRKVTAIV